MNAVDLEELLLAHRTQCIRYAMKLCVSPEDAEDATQEALLALARYVDALRSMAALSRWLFLAVRTHCMRLARRQLRYSLSIDDVPVAIEGPDPEDQLVDRQLRHRLALVLAALPPELRDVLVERDVRGRSAAEAAETLGISVAALKSRLHRARAETRARLLEAIG